MNKSFSQSVFISCFVAVAFVFSACSSTVNTNHDPHFDDEGYLIKDSLSKPFKMAVPSKASFYVEVSGSMNGFFRANQQTYFKADLWNIISYFTPISSGVNVLTNEGDDGARFTNEQFRTLMNTGAFLSTASTKVPLMLQTIINGLRQDTTSVAVLVSDMKYSPVGSLAPSVLMTQYSSDISSILGQFGKAASLVCATSNYVDRNGQNVCEKSPYYYLILGKPEYVAMMRNCISFLLQNNGHFVDNFDSGFDFKSPKYTFGTTNKCSQLDDEPTFIDYEEADETDTCSINLKIDLEDYRWIMANDTYFKQAFKCVATYGSTVKVKSVSIDVKNITGENRELNRKVVATVNLQIFNMATDSEVINWYLELPDTDYSFFYPFFKNANNENDPSKSYSVLDFVKGMYQGGIVNNKTKHNYILVSKKG